MTLLRNVILAIGLGGLTVGAFGCGGGSKSEETTPAATETPAEEGAGEAAPAEGEMPAEGEAPAEGGEAPAEGGEAPAEGGGEGGGGQ